MQGQSDDMSSGTNAPNGVIVRYFSRKPSSEIKLQFLTKGYDKHLLFYQRLEG
jgi:hypothetical protein